MYATVASYGHIVDLFHKIKEMISWFHHRYTVKCAVGLRCEENTSPPSSSSTTTATTTTTPFWLNHLHLKKMLINLQLGGKKVVFQSISRISKFRAWPLKFWMIRRPFGKLDPFATPSRKGEPMFHPDLLFFRYTHCCLNYGALNKIHLLPATQKSHACVTNYQHEVFLLSLEDLLNNCWVLQRFYMWRTTRLPETNIDPENRPSRKEFHLPTINSQGICSFQGGYCF